MSLPVGKLISTAPAALPSGGVRRVLFGVMFAILVVPNSILILCFGLVGSSGNSFVTGGLLVAVTLGLGLLCFRRDIVLQSADYMFFGLLLCVVSSLAFNGWTSNAKEYELLVVSLAAYPACRFVSRADVLSGRFAFAWATGAVVVLGTIATAIALWQQWTDEHGKPYVFGFDSAGTSFLGSLCFLVVALVTAGGLTMRRTLLISLLIFLPMAIFAAALVRFTFIALVGTLCFAAVLCEARQRKYVIAIAVVVLVAAAAGLFARYDHANANYTLGQPSLDHVTTGQVVTSRQDFTTAQVVTASSENVGSKMIPSCYLKIDIQNSIAIRRVLLQDAAFLLPGSGWFGTGLDSFMKVSCIKSTEVHNSILQAAVEFGWLGGALLLALIVVAGSSMLALARHDDASRFVLCSLAFVVLLSLAHGRVSRDGALFALLGCAVGLKETSRASARDTSVAVA